MRHLTLVLALLVACGGRKTDDEARRRDCQAILDTLPKIDATIRFENPGFLAACTKAEAEVVRCLAALQSRKAPEQACQDAKLVHQSLELARLLRESKPAP